VWTFRPTAWFAPSLAALCGTPLAGQASLGGTVREDSTDRPLADVEVVLLGYALQARTNATGRYDLRGLPAGSHVVLFRAIGYQPHTIRVTLREGRTLALDPTVIPSVVQLEEIEVRAPQPLRTGFWAFEQRRALGFGQFIDSTVLRRSEHLRLADVLRRHTKVDLDSGIPASRRRQGTYGRCEMPVFLDGAPSRVPLRLIDVATLDGVEVYFGPADTPAEFSVPYRSCGAVVLWTRRPGG